MIEEGKTGRGGGGGTCLTLVRVGRTGILRRDRDSLLLFTVLYW